MDDIFVVVNEHAGAHYTWWECKLNNCPFVLESYFERGTVIDTGRIRVNLHTSGEDANEIWEENKQQITELMYEAHWPQIELWSYQTTLSNHHRYDGDIWLSGQDYVQENWDERMKISERSYRTINCACDTLLFAALSPAQEYGRRYGIDPFIILETARSIESRAYNPSWLAGAVHRARMRTKYPFLPK